MCFVLHGVGPGLMVVWNNVILKVLQTNYVKQAEASLLEPSQSSIPALLSCIPVLLSHLPVSRLPLLHDCDKQKRSQAQIKTWDTAECRSSQHYHDLWGLYSAVDQCYIFKSRNDVWIYRSQSDCTTKCQHLQRLTTLMSLMIARLKSGKSCSMCWLFPLKLLLKWRPQFSCIDIMLEQVCEIY